MGSKCYSHVNNQGTYVKKKVNRAKNRNLWTSHGPTYKDFHRMSVSPDTFNPHDVKLYSSKSDNSCMILFISGQYGRFLPETIHLYVIWKKISQIPKAVNITAKRLSEGVGFQSLRDPTFALTIPKFRSSAPRTQSLAITFHLEPCQ